MLKSNEMTKRCQKNDTKKWLKQAIKKIGVKK